MIMGSILQRIETSRSAGLEPLMPLKLQAIVETARAALGNVSDGRFRVLIVGDESKSPSGCCGGLCKQPITSSVSS
jgi:hypothetical protein